LNALRVIIERLGAYFSDKCRENLDKVTKAKIELTAQEHSFLTGHKTEIDALIEKLEGLRTLSFFSLRDIEEVGDRLTPLKINLGMMDKLDSEETRKTVDPINRQLDALVEKVGSLKGKDKPTQVENSQGNRRKSN